MTISEQLREAINESGETIYRIAKEAGLSHSPVLRFAKGERSLQADSLDKLAAVFDMRLTRAKRLVRR